ncbi:MAG: EcsC family protein, partial [Alistipes sp.]|nr:EcsC family protein [Alistipes sp.]
LFSSLYMELRMIAGIAMIRGYDVHDDQVKTAVYMCLIFNMVGDVLKQVGIQAVEKIAVKKLLPKLTQEIIVKINKAVGFRLLTKGGTKGLVNLGKVIPLFGGIVGAAYNWAEVAICAKAAKKMFNEDK